VSVFSQVAKPSQGAAWVTGASGGIGRAVALKLAKEGWEVWVTARSLDELEALAAEMPGKIKPLAGDVTDPAAMREIVDKITAQGPLVLAILNAGIYTPLRAHKFDVTTANKMIDVNLKGVINGLDPVMKHMMERKSGVIAITASVAGYRGLPASGPYSASKAGLIALAESLAMDLVQHNVRLSVINPGFVETHATSVNKFKMPFLMQADEAAQRIVLGLNKSGFEITFPRRFSLLLRMVGLLPNRAYLWVVRKLLGMG